MPELNSLDGGVSADFYSQQNDNFPFATGEVDMMTGGVVTSFYAVSLPDAGFDSLALSLLENYKPFAIPLIKQWAARERKGVMIDLRFNKTETNRADYVLEGQDGITIPIIFLWDRFSAGRAASWIQVLQSSPVMHCRQAGGSKADMHGGRGACF